MGVPQQLAQQQLVSAPVRRLRVFGDCTATWGVDPSTRGVSIAVVNDDVKCIRTVQFPVGLEIGQALAVIHRETRELARRLAAMSIQHRPGLVLVEQPSGAHQNPPLLYAAGVVQAAIYEGAASETGIAPRMETVTSTWWKRRACGSGSIKKPKRKADGEYAVLTWARLNGYPGSSWDEADALGIAEAGRLDVALDPA